MSESTIRPAEGFTLLDIGGRDEYPLLSVSTRRDLNHGMVVETTEPTLKEFVRIHGGAEVFFFPYSDAGDIRHRGGTYTIIPNDKIAGMTALSSIEQKGDRDIK
jgi:hypothetical protein